MIRVLFAIAVVLPFPAGTADVFKCVTENGVVRYSSTPCRDGTTEKLDIENRPTDVDAVRERIEKRKEQIAALNEAEAESEKAGAEAARKEEERKQQCDAARKRLQDLMIARRVTTGEGEDVQFMDSEEIVRLREEAQQKVNELCRD